MVIDVNRPCRVGLVKKQKMNAVFSSCILEGRLVWRLLVLLTGAREDFSDPKQGGFPASIAWGGSRPRVQTRNAEGANQRHGN